MREIHVPRLVNDSAIHHDNQDRLTVLKQLAPSQTRSARWQLVRWTS
jgi:hypothetical protein